MHKLSNQILDLPELEKLASNLCKDICVGDIYLFQGELGAGKTTLVKLLINNLYLLNNLSKPASIASSPSSIPPWGSCHASALLSRR